MTYRDPRQVRRDGDEPDDETHNPPPTKPDCTWCGEPSTWRHFPSHEPFCANCGRCEDCLTEIADPGDHEHDAWLCVACAVDRDTEPDYDEPPYSDDEAHHRYIHSGAGVRGRLGA